MIPDGWKSTTLDAASDINAPIRYGVVQIGPHTPDGVPIVAIKFISRIASAPLHRASKMIEGSYKNSRIQGGDVLLSVKGTIGEVGVVPSGFNGNIAREIARIRPGKNVRADYLAYQLQAPETQGRIKAVIVGTTRLEFSISAVKKFEILLPPLPEQHRIAEILSTWDHAIEAVEALIANARAQKKALMQSILTAQTRLPGFSEAWEQYDFGSFAELIKEKVDPRKLRDDVLGVELEHIDAESGRLLGTCQANVQMSLKTPFTRTSILYGKLRPYLRKFAKPDFDGVCSTEIWALAAKTDVCMAEFLHLLVQSPVFEGAVDISSGSKMPRADWGIVRDTMFAMPSVTEQVAITRILHDADRTIEAHEHQLTALRQERTALMQQLLTGRRRVAPERQSQILAHAVQ